MSMYESFFQEFEKISRAGEGSRGGKVIGHTKSGNPIYESSKKSGSSKKKVNWRDRAAKGAAIASTAALIGVGVFKRNQWQRFRKAAKNYERTKGPYARGQGSSWRDFKKTGDDFFGDNPRWEKVRDDAHAAHEAYKRASKAGSGWGSSRGRSRGSRGRSAGSQRTSSQQGNKAYDHIPGLGKVKTKKDAQQAYKAAARKNHPDLGGDPEKMKNINSSWDDFKTSPLYEKLAMAYWSKMASALLK